MTRTPFAEVLQFDRPPSPTSPSILSATLLREMRCAGVSQSAAHTLCHTVLRRETGWTMGSSGAGDTTTTTTTTTTMVLLMLGPPGCGKLYAARRLAMALGRPYCYIDVQQTDTDTLIAQDCSTGILPDIVQGEPRIVAVLHRAQRASAEVLDRLLHMCYYHDHHHQHHHHIQQQQCQDQKDWKRENYNNDKEEEEEEENKGRDAKEERTEGEDHSGAPTRQQDQRGTDTGSAIIVLAVDLETAEDEEAVARALQESMRADIVRSALDRDGNNSSDGGSGTGGSRGERRKGGRQSSTQQLSDALDGHSVVDLLDTMASFTGRMRRVLAEQILTGRCSSAFLDRIDAIIPFFPVSRQELLHNVVARLQAVARMAKDTKGLRLTFGEDAVLWLMARYRPSIGVDALVDAQVLTMLASIDSELRKGDAVHLSVEGDNGLTARVRDSKGRSAVLRSRL